MNRTKEGNLSFKSCQSEFFFGLGLSHTYSRYMKTILCNLENGEERVKEKFQQQTIIDATRKQINETYMRSQFSG